MKNHHRQLRLLSMATLLIPVWLTGCDQVPETSDVPTEAQSITQVAYVALLFRSEHNRLPESMDEILEYDETTPQTDEWDNKFQFDRQDDEFIVYSAGPDQQIGTEDDLRAVLKSSPAE
ncbi:MAG: hypothetical protein HUJ26_22400 [Planctomycetaceae bacterium]|nr:hypothetical protein [Planctomycetaceae bacterium]